MPEVRFYSWQIKMKRIASVIIAVVIMVSLLVGCNFLSKKSPGGSDIRNDMTVGNSQEQNDQSGQKNIINLALYFANQDNSAVPSETRTIEIKDNNIVKAAIEALLKGPESGGLKKAIPDGTKLLEAYIKDGTAYVDFSQEYKKANDIAEVVERISIVNTLTGIDGINKVKILVEGKDLIGPSGEPFGELTRAALDESGKPVPGEMKKLVLYFGNSEAEALVPETREVGLNKGDSIEKTIIEELMKGPSGTGLDSPIPHGTRLISVETKDGICTVNFSREFISNHSGGSAGESITLYSIVNSLTELDSVKRVQFLIEGAHREAFIHLELDEPLTRDESMIQK